MDACVHDAVTQENPSAMGSRALVADDHPLFRSAMKQALAEVLGAGIVEAEDLNSTLKALEDDPTIELVFLDLNMPGNEGLTGLSELRHQFPDVLVVIVSAEEHPEAVQKAIELGSSGYIPKSTPLAQIAEAVMDVLDGKQWLPKHLEGQQNDRQNAQQREFAEKVSQLTPHQFTVLKMMADGLLNKQIAYELGVKETTIKQHGSAILKKLGVINRTQAGVMFKQLMSTGHREQGNP